MTKKSFEHIRNNEELNDICQYKGKGITFDLVDKITAINMLANETLQLDLPTLVSTFSHSKVFKDMNDFDTGFWLKPTEELTELFLKEVAENGIHKIDEAAILEKL